MEERGEEEANPSRLEDSGIGEAGVQVVAIHGYGLVAEDGDIRRDEGRKYVNSYAELVGYILDLPPTADEWTYKRRKLKSYVVHSDDSWI